MKNTEFGKILFGLAGRNDSLLFLEIQTTEYMFKLMTPLWEIQCISDFLLASQGLQVNKPVIISRATIQKYFFFFFANAKDIQNTKYFGWDFFFCFVKIAINTRGRCGDLLKPVNTREIMVWQMSPVGVANGARGMGRWRVGWAGGGCGVVQTKCPTELLFDIETSDKQKIESLIRFLSRSRSVIAIVARQTFSKDASKERYRRVTFIPIPRH